MTLFVTTLSLLLCRNRTQAHSANMLLQLFKVRCISTHLVAISQAAFS